MPNIMIGNDRLQIFGDQVVFNPIITVYDFIVEAYRDYGNLQDSIGSLVDNGDNPPLTSQLTINSDPIRLGNNLNMEHFRITTSIFTAVIADAPYGTSLKDYMEEGPLPTGNYPAMVDGFFVIIKLPPPNKDEISKTYWIHSWASAGREARGHYFSELLYEIEVFPPRSVRGLVTSRYPARNEVL